MALNLKPSPEPSSCCFHDPTALAGTRGKEQSRAAGCPGMVGSCRSYKKSRLYRVCISEAVEGTGRFQGSWHPYATTCNTISRSLSPVLSQIHRQLHSQQDKTEVKTLSLPQPLKNPDKLCLKDLTVSTHLLLSLYQHHERFKWYYQL